MTVVVALSFAGMRSCSRWLGRFWLVVVMVVSAVVVAFSLAVVVLVHFALALACRFGSRGRTRSTLASRH